MATATTTNANSTILSVEDCAAELQLAPLDVKRLIARESLPATLIGEPERGVWRITRPDLEQFVAAGAKDARRLHVENSSGWFAFNLLAAMQDFRREVIAAAQPQILSEAEFEKRLPTAALRKMDVTISLSPAINAIVDSPADSRRTVRMRNAEPLPFQKFGEMFLAERLQLAARRASLAGRSWNRLQPITAVDQFFSSPTRHREILSAAFFKVRGEGISFTEERATKTYRNGQSVTVTYTLPLSTFARPELLEAIATLMF